MHYHPLNVLLELEEMKAAVDHFHMHDKDFIHCFWCSNFVKSCMVMNLRIYDFAPMAGFVIGLNYCEEWSLSSTSSRTSSFESLFLKGFVID